MNGGFRGVQCILAKVIVNIPVPTGKHYFVIAEFTRNSELQKY